MKKYIRISLFVLCLCIVSAIGLAAQAAGAPGGVRVVLDGVFLDFDQPPVIQDGRTLVPLRVIFEAMGADVDWEDGTQTVTAARGNDVISLTIGRKAATKNGATITLDVPPALINGRTLVPVRFIAESFGAEVAWDDATQTVIIAMDDMAQRLLIGNGKLKPFGYITEHGGAVYAAKFLCIPEWKPINAVDNYMSRFGIVGDKVIYTQVYGTGPDPCELYVSDIDGGNKKLITNEAMPWNTFWIAGDKVIFERVSEKINQITINNQVYDSYETVHEGIYCYDVSTEKTTKPFVGENSIVVSYDDNYVYYMNYHSMNISRVRWDGTQAEEMRGVTLPEGVFGEAFSGVYDGYYYFVYEEYDGGNTLVYVDGYPIYDSKNSAGLNFGEITIMYIKDSYVYFAVPDGIYKRHMNTGFTERLADMEKNVELWSIYRVYKVGGHLYFIAYNGDDSPYGGTRLYRVPVNGGRMEFMNKEWFES